MKSAGLWFLGIVGGIVALSKATVAAASPGVQAFGQAIAGAEGWGLPNNIGTGRNNPGNLTDPATGQIRSFDTAAAGWSALYAMLAKIGAGGALPLYSPTMTIADMAMVYTATQQDAWASNVVGFLHQQGYANTDQNTPIGVFLS